MQTISSLKEQLVTDTPLIVFDCTLSNGAVEHWSTHSVTVNGTAYDPRVIQHSAFDIQTASDQGVDGSPKITLLLGNADSYLSELAQSPGWKGARLTVSFLFYDLRNQVPLTDASVVFQGICNPPDQIKEATFRLTATNRMNLQRLWLPDVHVQRRCPWTFPATVDQRVEATDGGVNGEYSLFYNCGYSADVTGGKGLLNGGVAYTGCGYTRTDCQARGMWTRFGGLEFVPPVIAVRGYGKDWTSSNLAINQARYNDFVPMVYGAAWYNPLVVFARNDGNLTRMEVLLGVGQMQGVLTVLVNDVQIPLGVNGQNMTGTGWYNLQTLGTRDGALDANFTDSTGAPAGDPYGSMAYLSVVVPNALSSGDSLPTVQVLVQGLIVPTYNTDGAFASNQFSSNPAWILLDVLRRSGWQSSEIDISSFAASAAYCDQTVNTTDLNGNPIAIPRFACNLVIQKRKSAGDIIRGIRNASRLFLTYSSGGLLQLAVENTLALQQPTQLSCSNSTEPLDGGWPAYEFGDGSNGFTGILRKSTGEPSITVSSRPISDTPNTLSVEFQDNLNGYQQDSFNVNDPADVALAGQQVTGTLMAIGLPNYDQAGRILQFTLDKSVNGNTYIEFDTSVMGFGIRPGDLITVTYLKEGFDRQPFRVIKISPSTNYRTCTISAQIHDDAWYGDSNGQSTASGPGQTGSSAGLPRPLIGSLIDSNGNIQFGVAETDTVDSDGSTDVSVAMSFLVPATSAAPGPGVPLLNLIPQVTTGGSLTSGQTLYYALSGSDSAGNESILSFIARASVIADSSSVVLSGLSFASGTATFNVYRGVTPSELFRIASAQPIAAQFTDTGLADQLYAPPDPNFDHANFYYRMESLPETAVSIFSTNTIGASSLHMGLNSFRGSAVRITRGRGAGQEAAVTSNTATTLTTTPAWVVEPDATSFFTVAESGWHFAAVSQSSPVSFSIPNYAGETVQLTGRSANAADVESASQLAIVTRWQIGGSADGDSDVPPQPQFGIGQIKGGGGAELSGVSFTDLINTKTISSATLFLHYWDETQGATTLSLAADCAAADATINLNNAASIQPQQYLQIEAEVLQVSAVSGNVCTVTRGLHGSTAAAHTGSPAVYPLTTDPVIAPFPDQFFGSGYSGNWTYPVLLPDVRIASAELFVTNQIGNSPTAAICLTHSAGSGLRTLAGGQYSIQVAGYLSVDSNVAPALVTDTLHSVRDVYAVLGASADVDVKLQVSVNGTAYALLTVPAGTYVSNTVDGWTLPPISAGAKITLAVQTVGTTYPGADLTVLIRL